MLPDQEAKELLHLAKENNRMLKDMRRDAFIGGVMHFVWLIVVFVVVPYFTWLWLQPYLEQMTAAYAQAQGQSDQLNQAVESLKNAGSGFDLQGLIDRFTGGGSN